MGAEAQVSGGTERRIEIAVTVLLAAATLATAWAGYQSSRWHSEQAKAQARATASRIEAARSAGMANRQVQVDIALFTEWIDARAQGDAELTDFYSARFTDRLKPAFRAWIATDPFARPDAPSSPFVMVEYRVEATSEADSLEAEASAAATDAREDIDHADRYVLAVVLFAACLFLAGLSTRLGMVPGADGDPGTRRPAVRRNRAMDRHLPRHRDALSSSTRGDAQRAGATYRAPVLEGRP